MNLGIFGYMRQQQVLCIIIDHHPATTHLLAAALRSSEYAVRVVSLSGWHKLLSGLKEQRPALLFTPHLQRQSSERKLLNVLKQQSPDTVLVHAATRRWRHIQMHASGVESCMISTVNEDVLLQQVDFLLRYAQLKGDFRQCKHFLSIAELRCQWLVDHSREAIAYVAHGRHLHANLEYLALFGFHSADAAVVTPLATLIDEQDRAAFNPLQHDAAFSVRSSGKTLVTLQRTDQQLFRAEVRFIPAVYQGQRCVQIHVHPIARLQQAGSVLGKVSQQTRPASKRPAKPLAATHRPKTSLNLKAGKRAATLPVSGKAQQTTGLQAQFDEALNLKMHKQSALLFAEPVLTSKNGQTIAYPAVIRQLGQRGDKRFKFDLWNVRKSIMRIERDPTRRDGFCVYIALGHWVLRDKTGIQRLFAVLRHVPQATLERLVLALPFALLQQHARSLAVLIHQLRRTGVRLAMDEFSASRQAVALALMLDVWAVRLSVHHSGRALAEKGQVDQRFQQMMQRLEQKNVAVIINGVENLSVLNGLCATSAAYLQGSILHEFNQRRTA